MDILTEDYMNKKLEEWLIKYKDFYYDGAIFPSQITKDINLFNRAIKFAMFVEMCLNKTPIDELVAYINTCPEIVYIINDNVNLIKIERFGYLLMNDFCQLMYTFYDSVTEPSNMHVFIEEYLLIDMKKTDQLWNKFYYEFTNIINKNNNKTVASKYIKFISFSEDLNTFFYKLDSSIAQTLKPLYEIKIRYLCNLEKQKDEQRDRELEDYDKWYKY